MAIMVRITEQCAATDQAVVDCTIQKMTGVEVGIEPAPEQPAGASLQGLVAARRAMGLTQSEIARRMGTTASAVCRLEASLTGNGHSPSFATLSRYVNACGRTLIISIN